ncbi:MAG: phosphatidate cytidylyltransferase, partial [Myxococcota bacterium]|nr:phosphatidate cytidylyltransferase [Myxococcota bacterium]
MLTRLITGLILAPLVLWLCVSGPPWAVAAALLLAVLLCALELYRMVLPDRRLETACGVALIGLGLVVYRFFPEHQVVVAAALLVLPACVVLARPKPIEEAALRMLGLWGGIVYIGVAGAFLLEAGREPGHLVLAFALVWFGDTGAYFVGKAIGRHHLYPLVSPNKTWEGAAGGLVGSVAGAFAVRWWLLPDLDPTICVIVALFGGAVGQLGDLAESALKRATGVKDSGSILPGHGGMLDRLDGLLLAAPVVVLF